MRMANQVENLLSAAQDALLADALFGIGLPAAAEDHLTRAGLAYQQDDVAEQHLREARALAPDHAAVLIGIYRFYFYKGRLREALDIARACLTKAAQDNGLVADWRRVRAADADFASFDAVLPRFYLFTLKAYAYLQMRLGHLEEGGEAVHKLLELDPSDKLNARLLLNVWQRKGRDDEG